MRTNFIESRTRQRTPRGGLFLRLLEAFHRSRRREAIRVLRRHRHAMVDKTPVRIAKAASESL